MVYKRLVLSSGSLKGFQYVGLLRVLEERNLVAPIKEYVGVSIGSLFALFMVLNYTSNEIADILMELDLRSMMFPNILQLVDTYGIVEPTEIIKLIKMLLKRKNVSEDITMEGLFHRFEKKYIVFATVLGDEHRGISICYESHPHMEVWRAAIMSISIPFIFPPVRYNDCYYVDGGIKNHFPIDKYPKEETLGCNLLEILGHEHTFSNYVQMVYSSIYSNVPDKLLYNVINMRVDLSIVEFFLDNKTKQFLFDKGYEQAKLWFEEKTIE